VTNIFRNDTYQLSMLYAHWRNNRTGLFTSAEAFFRKRPADLNGATMEVVMAAGYRINEMLNSEMMEQPFTHEDMPFVQETLSLSDEAFEPFQTYLLEHFPRELRSLEIRYAQDGEVLAPNFPVVQVTGPVGPLHMLETPLLSFLNTNVRAASIANCLRELVGPSKSLLDFATRRQDDSAAVHVAVSSIIGGFDGTSNMDAGRLYHVPAKGTMAHAYVLSYGMGGELQAFKDFMRAFPANHTLLVDTYDIQQGVANAIRASFETGISLRAIRLDSGDWFTTLLSTRRMLDMMGCRHTKITVSGDYTEAFIAKLKERNLFDLIDGVGIGSRLGSPEFSMGFVYKLVDAGGQPVMKFSGGGKSSLPGRKVWMRKRGTECYSNRLFVVDSRELAESRTGTEYDEVLVEDAGPTPVGMDYIREARARTKKHRWTPITEWNTKDIDALADTLTRT